MVATVHTSKGRRKLQSHDSGIAAGPTSVGGIVVYYTSLSPLFLSLEMRATTASGGSSRTSFNLQAAQGVWRRPLVLLLACFASCTEADSVPSYYCVRQWSTTQQLASSVHIPWWSSIASSLPTTHKVFRSEGSY